MRKFSYSALLAYCVAESQNTFELTSPSPFLNNTHLCVTYIPTQLVGQHILQNNLKLRHHQVYFSCK